MRIHAARVVPQDNRRVLERRGIVVVTASDVSEPPEHHQIQVSETLAFDNSGVVLACAQIATVQIDGLGTLSA